MELIVWILIGIGFGTIVKALVGRGDKGNDMTEEELYTIARRNEFDDEP